MIGCSLYPVELLYTAMDHCCYDCPVANCTVGELLCHISYGNICSCNNGTSTVAAAIMVPLLVVFGITTFIITALFFYHYVYKKNWRYQLDTRSDHNGSGGAVGILSLFYRNICKKNSRHQNDQSDTRPDQQNEENTESRGAEGITYDVVVSNEARVTAPEMKRNEAYARGLTGQK